jgi:hypothetical protein
MIKRYSNDVLEPNTNIVRQGIRTEGKCMSCFYTIDWSGLWKDGQCRCGGIIQAQTYIEITE